MSKKNILLILILVSILALAGCNKQVNTVGDENSLSLIQEKGKFVVGLDDNFPPMGFIDESGELSGFDIDLAREVGKRLKVDVEFKPTEWDGVVLSLINKDIDLIWNGLTITEDRKEKIDFSKAYLDNKQIIVINKDKGIYTLNDLKGKIIGAQLESSSSNALDKNEELRNSLEEVKYYGTNTEAFLDLKIGRIDALVVDEILARYYISKSNDKFDVLKEDLGEELYGVGFRKGEKTFIEAVNKALEEMKEDGTATEISKKWFGKDIFILEE